MMKLISTVLLSLLFSVHAFAGEANYDNIFSKIESTFSVSDSRVRLFDVTHQSKKCGISDEYACVDSNVFVFAIPRNIGNRKKWNYSNANYEILHKRTAIFNGKLISYKIINQIWNGKNYEYAFADEYGVIGIKDSSGNQLFLTNRCGFAALTNKEGCKSE